MSILLKDFTDKFLYRGQLVEVSGVGPDSDGNFVRFEGKKEEIPEKLHRVNVRFVAMNGRDDDPYTVRIECDFDSDAGVCETDMNDFLEHFVKNFLYEGQDVEISSVGPDENDARYEGPADEIPNDLKRKRVRYVASSARSEAPNMLRIECALRD